MRFDGRVVRTPLIPFAGDARLWLKPENLQPFGSYKIRGVETAVNLATPDQLQNGLTAASAGNMAQAVAYAARELQIPCRIYVPDSAPEIKKAAIRQLGAELVERPFPEIWQIVQRNSVNGDRGMLIHPAQTESLRVGYGSIGREILADQPESDAVVIPFGVGGLALGIAAAMKSLQPAVAVYLAEPETAAPFAMSLRTGKASQVERVPSFVDAIGVPEVLPYVFEHLSKLVDGSKVVSIRNAEAAVAKVFRQHRMVIEGAAGCALAAAESIATEGRYRRIAVILSGGNIDPHVLQTILGRN